eukprot:8529-Heterococcus_DN1.PRE.2
MFLDWHTLLPCLQHHAALGLSCLHARATHCQLCEALVPAHTNSAAVRRSHIVCMLPQQALTPSSIESLLVPSICTGP